MAATGAALVPRYPGTMLQVANNGAVVHSPDPAALSSEVMFGNMLQAVGVQAVTSYYGMGFKAFTDVLCIEFNGSVCPDALRRAFEPPAPGAPPLGRPAAARDGRRPERAARSRRRRRSRTGWRVAERTVAVTVLRRDAALPHPQGRLSDAPAGTVVADDVAAARGEVVRITGGPGGTLTFARLAWPGYTARVDGAELPVRQGPAGLLTVDVPAGAHELSWPGRRPPSSPRCSPPCSVPRSRSGTRSPGRSRRRRSGRPEAPVVAEPVPRRRGARRLALTTLGDPERVPSSGRPTIERTLFSQNASG